MEESYVQDTLDSNGFNTLDSTMKSYGVCYSKRIVAILIDLEVSFRPCRADDGRYVKIQAWSRVWRSYEKAGDEDERTYCIQHFNFQESLKSMYNTAPVLSTSSTSASQVEASRTIPGSPNRVVPDVVSSQSERKEYAVGMKSDLSEKIERQRKKMNQVWNMKYEIWNMKYEIWNTKIREENF